MTPPLEPHWVCATCERDYAATPLQCACGSREFTPVTLDVGGLGVKAAVAPCRHPMVTIFDSWPAYYRCNVCGDGWREGELP